LDSLQSDIDALEAEKAELKKRLVAQSKQRNVLTDLAFKSPAGAAVPGARSEIASMLASSTAGLFEIRSFMQYPFICVFVLV